MTEKPNFMTVNPAPTGNVLSDLLASMHLSGTILFRAEFTEPWGLLAPGAAQISRILPFRTEHIIPFHIIVRGHCWGQLLDGEGIWLEEGDAILLPYGDSHILRGRQEAEAVPAVQLLPPPPWPEALEVQHGGNGDGTSIICGFVQCDELLFHPLLRQLPSLMHVSPKHNAGEEWLASTIRHTAAEAARNDPGSRSMLPRLTEIMFVEILRKHIQSLSSSDVGWLAAVNDPVVGQALKLLHNAPLKDWNVDNLALSVSVSRTILTERFNRYLDMPPMRYLTYWRLQIAAQTLKTSEAPLKNIADQAGYESEAAFSRAFKRHFGCPPADWRRRQELT